MLSFWEREAFVNFDQLVLGGGIVGLSTAIELKMNQPNAKVAVLERGVFPTGASTKNAGFACFGSLTEVLADLSLMSEAEVFALVKQRWDGLQLLRKRLGDAALDYQNFGGYELLRSEAELAALHQIDRVNALLGPLFDQDVYQPADSKIADFGFNHEKVGKLVFNPFEGQIHTGKMMKALQAYAANMGIELYAGTEVESYDENTKGVTVQIKDGPQLKASQVAICTNAFTHSLYPPVKLVPGRGVVLVTEPIRDLKFKGTFHYDEGYYYFRNYQNRLIFGGGRNLDKRGESTTTFGERDLILNKLKKDMDELILPNTPYEIDMVWSGIMAFGSTKQPVLKRHSDRVFLGVRLGGMGVAIGSLLGKELASLMRESANN